MKKIGEYTIRGQMNVENTFNKIVLFDGSFKTAYKVISFEVAPYDTKTAANDVAAKLCTDPGALADGALWDWADNREIAWAASETRVSFGPSFGRFIIDPDNLVVEDLYISYGHVSTDSPVNYLIKMEKYSITDWQGALALVRNNSQDV